MKVSPLLIIVAAIMFAMIPEGFSQRGGQSPRGGFNNLPDLTQEQQTAIRQLQSERISSGTLYRAQMNELQAQKRTLSLADNPDMNKINGIIDQMEKLRADNHKQMAAHRQAVRQLLTTEQKAIFDSTLTNRGKGMHYNQQGFKRRGRLE
jgi:Spy/CpxP family protein refolding chaperone